MTTSNQKTQSVRWGVIGPSRAALGIRFPRE
jgi:hypothetical protein